MIEIRECKWGDLYPECEEMMKSHHRELRAPGEFSLDLEMISKMSGALSMWGAFSPSLIGYLIWYLSPDLTSRGSIIATQGAWYVTPKERRTSAGRELYLRSLAALQKSGVQRAFGHFWHTNALRDVSHERFFTALGGRMVETTFLLELQGPWAIRPERA